MSPTSPPPPAISPSTTAPTTKAILLGSGPRFLRDGFGPVLAFYVGWKLAGLGVGIALATVVGLVAFRLARREERTGALAQLALGFVLIQAVVGLASGSARVYLAQPVLMSGLLGVAFFASAFTRRPIIGILAAETYPFPPELRASALFRDVFARCSMVWGVYQVARAGIRLLVLTQTSVDAYVLVNFATGFPMMAGMFSWTAWYSVRAFGRAQPEELMEAGGPIADPAPQPA